VAKSADKGSIGEGEGVREGEGVEPDGGGAACAAELPSNVIRGKESRSASKAPGVAMWKDT
jgi:hypothetical protein